VVTAVKIDTKEKYDAKYRRRGERMRRQKNGPRRDYTNLAGHHPHAYRSKPNHQDRAVSIADCFPLVGRKAEEVHYPIERMETVSKV
jgi:hypothetical protein